MRLTLLSTALTALTLLIPHAYATDFKNHIGMVFRTVPAGNFYMGSCKAEEQTDAEAGKTANDAEAAAPISCPETVTADPDAMPYEQPLHQVSIEKPFQIGIFEVTLEQFLLFLKETEQRTELLSDEFVQYNGLGRPVVEVSWHDAQKFAEWLNASKPEGDKGMYRLPSEAEWEYAARAGTQTLYWWGNEMEESQANCAGCDEIWGGEQSTKVGYFTPNTFGLHDMLGNASEWVADCWNHNYKGAPTDGSAWMSGNCIGHVIRGGAWTNPPWMLRSSERSWNVADYRHLNIGFRLVREADAKELLATAPDADASQP